MYQKSLDGIRTIRKQTPQKITYITPLLTPDPHAPQKGIGRFLRLVPAGMLVLVIATGFGLFTVSKYSVAEDISAVAQAKTETIVTQQILPNNQVQSGTASAIDIFLNTTISLLPEYQSTVVDEAKISERKQKLKAYLEGRRSPFADEDVLDTIVRQPHWKIILAVANAESSMGRSCPDKNCSGIGVAPGHELWRKYKDIKNWVLDLNRLLERRYNTSSLKDMCGVYVQPCNDNWLAATHQVIDELNEKSIN